MKKELEFSKKLINYMYLSVCKTMKQVPFSGRHWLEEFMIGAAHYSIEAHLDKIDFTSNDPLASCQAFLDFLVKENFINKDAYQIERSGEDLLLTAERAKCVYGEYCLRAGDEDLIFYCARLGTFQAVLRHVLGKIYHATIEVDEGGVCHGRLSPATRPVEDIVKREGHVLKIAGRRAVLFPQETYGSLMMSIKEHAPHALKHVLYDAGYRSGLSLAIQTRGLYTDIEECFKFLLDVLRNDGLGYLELVSLDLARFRAELRCKDSFQVAITKEFGPLYRTPQVICDILRGAIAAYLGVLFEKEMICEEMECQSIGGDYCEFLAMPLPKNLLRKEEPRARSFK